MGVKKTVTEKALAANRRNAKRSTGPRTERGKNISRFNAVTTGLFAEHGYTHPRQFDRNWCPDPSPT